MIKLGLSIDGDDEGLGGGDNLPPLEDVQGSCEYCVQQLKESDLAKMATGVATIHLMFNLGLSIDYDNEGLGEDAKFMPLSKLIGVFSATSWRRPSSVLACRTLRASLPSERTRW